MRYRIRYLPDTVADMEEIKAYLALYYESTVNKFFTLLRDKILRLKDFPYSCPVYEDDPEYHKLVAGDYLVFYMVNEKEKTIEIHRIFHGSKDIKRYLGTENA